MTPNKILHYFIVADRSGSMAGQIDEVRDELYRHHKELIALAKSTTTEVRFHFMMFNSQMEWLSNGEPVQDFDSENFAQYKPQGMTALFDAMGMAIERAEYKIGTSLNPELEEVVIMAFSDGDENSSAKWNGRNLSELIISHQDLPGWTITFTGCDMSGLREISNMKLREDRMVSYNASEKAKAFKTMFKFVETSIKSHKQMSKTAFEKE